MSNGTTHPDGGIGHNSSTDLAIIDPHQATLPPAPAGWQKARLPELYLRAREALKECLRIDECLEWKRKAEAFASYYRQAQDKTPHNIALRIRLRAWRRCGELFLEMDQSDGVGINQKHTSSATAKSIGMSAADRLKAISLATMLEQEFENHIAQEPVPALSKLIPVTAYPSYGASPEQRAAASVIHALARIYHVAEKFPAEVVAAQITERDGSPALAGLTRDWLISFEKEHARINPDIGQLSARTRERNRDIYELARCSGRDAHAIFLDLSRYASKRYIADKEADRRPDHIDGQLYDILKANSGKVPDENTIRGIIDRPDLWERTWY